MNAIITLHKRNDLTFVSAQRQIAMQPQAQIQYGHISHISVAWWLRSWPGNQVALLPIS